MRAAYDLDEEELAGLLAGWGEPPFRARQVWDGLHRRLARPDELTDLPLALRHRLAEALAAGAERRGGADQRRRRHGEVAVAPARRRDRRDGPDALPGPRHRVHLDPGRLRHGVRVLRHGPGRLRAAPQRGRDRRAGRPGRPPVARRGPPPGERRVHGHGRAAGQLRRHVGRRRTDPRRPRTLGAPPHALDGRDRPGHPPARRRAAPGEPGGVAARRRRRPPRRARADQPPVPPRRPS